MSIVHLNGYAVDDTQWKVFGGGGATNIATKDGKEYFIKRMMDLVYPTNDSSDEYRRQQTEVCNEWLRRHKKLVETLPGTGMGNLVKPIEYFRDHNHLYEVAYLVKRAGDIRPEDVWRLPVNDKALIMMTVASTLADIHKVGVVHCDLDPENILISKSAGGRYITKLIDFTDAFLANNPPVRIMSKEYWWSPEVAVYSLYKGKGPNPAREYISCKADVFSLGIIFHTYCAKEGRDLQFESGSEFPWQELCQGRTLHIDASVDPVFRNIISDMLKMDPLERPDMSAVLKRLQGIVMPIAPEPRPTQPNTSQRSNLRPGRGTKKNGARVSAIESLPNNPNKVRVFFSDNSSQIYDLGFAEALEYVIR